MKESIYIKLNNFYHKIDVTEIEWLQSEGNYTTLFVGDKKYVVKMSLSQLQTELPEQEFAQIHKRYVVNLDKIERLSVSNNQLIINETPLPIGRTFKSSLLEQLNLL